VRDFLQPELPGLFTQCPVPSICCTTAHFPSFCGVLNQDLAAFFEDHMQEWMDSFAQLLTMPENPALADDVSFCCAATLCAASFLYITHLLHHHSTPCPPASSFKGRGKARLPRARQSSDLCQHEPLRREIRRGIRGGCARVVARTPPFSFVRPPPLTRRPPSALSGQFRGNHLALADDHAAGCPLRRRT